MSARGPFQLPTTSPPNSFLLVASSFPAGGSIRPCAHPPASLPHCPQATLYITPPTLLPPPPPLPPCPQVALSEAVDMVFEFGKSMTVHF